MRSKIILLALLALFGVFLLRGGIVGFVVSESCCFGNECAPENMCPAEEASLQSPALLSPEDNNALSVVGLLIIVISVLMVSWYLKKRVNKNKKEEEGA